MAAIGRGKLLDAAAVGGLSPGYNETMNLPPALTMPLIVVGVVCFWCFVVWVVARFGGWYALATRFPAGPKKPDGVRMYYMERLELGASQYKGCVSIGVAPSGLYLSVLPLFGVGHKPILVPWEAITKIKTEKQWWMTVYELSVPLEKFNTATITLFNAGLVAAITPHLALPASSVGQAQSVHNLPR